MSIIAEALLQLHSVTHRDLDFIANDVTYLVSTNARRVVCATSVLGVGIGYMWEQTVDEK